MTRLFTAAMTLAFLAAGPLSAMAQTEALKAEPAKAEPIRAVPTEAASPKAAGGVPAVRPLSVTVELTIDKVIEGTLTDTTQLQMQTSFGTASIPLSEVAGIRFASADDATTTVVMLNGDSITGATDVKLITVETEWGTASINGPNLASIMFVPGLEWKRQDGLNGNRWSLTDKKTSPSSNRTGLLPPSANRSSTPSTQPRSTQSLPQPIQGTPVPSSPFRSGQQFYPNR